MNKDEKQKLYEDHHDKQDFHQQPAVEFIEKERI